MAGSYVMIDVYRDDFLGRRETIGDLPRVVEIGSDQRCRVWLDSPRVPPVAARLVIDEDGSVRMEGSRMPIAAGWAFRIDPFVLVLVKRPADQDPGQPQRVLRSVLEALPSPPIRLDPAPPAMSCPRCRAVMTETAMPPTGAAYRSAPTNVLACDACRILVVPRGVLADAGVLADSPATRRRRSAIGLCPYCRAKLQELVLSWGDDWLTIETCEACGATVVDRSEVGTLMRLGVALADR